ncbi:E3 ubiquitin-protein ligase RNF181 isoform X2 [Rhinopithecus roxellana]|uniref:E3 ubiquitin-protein ligase RNF181 isoform X2 n=1 Tax=Rhinopithecus roxellana TaxID=61622 RepID=UPI000533423A|nr:E3 ubiquitin-protein ligase RNF181 isoform X2 [Rhinopithecus roxellana]XP_017711806.1 PREDICTED: E3 ubiquitin-protein ligase RNF181 isoform X2 [Rhinopithecus bieti]XP_033031207.1 E3 ubiquitin-protein ligase RNF181 isoform X3 [Trachypithecus francoisi]
MASYFDEHDCEPSDPEQETRTNMLLELARSLFNRMDFEDLGLVVDWDHHLPPPAAKNVVENLPRTVIRGSQAELKCPVCLLEFEEEETAIEMPCHHLFHSSCILPWLNKTNSCPLCRHELPTDDDTYEEHRRDKSAFFPLGSKTAAATPTGEPPWSHVHVRRLGLSGGPLRLPY